MGSIQFQLVDLMGFFPGCQLKHSKQVIARMQWEGLAPQEICQGIGPCKASGGHHER